MRSLPTAALLVAAAALACTLPQPVHALLVFERAAILSGEFWRLLTANLVHLGASHLAFNLAAFLIVASYLEVRAGTRRLLAWLIVLSLPPTLLLLVTRPDMGLYGGLSPVTYGLVMVLCVGEVARSPGSEFWWGGLVLTPLLAAIPAFTDEGLNPLQGTGEVRVIWEAHLAAVLIGGGGAGWMRFRAARRRSSETCS